MENNRLLLILNPTAGKKLAQSRLFEIIDCFVKAGYEVTVHTTQNPGDATTQLMARGEQYGRVVCCGGDGTLNEAVTGLERLSRRPMLGYIPTGTTNDFAQSLGFSRNPLEAAQTAATGVPFPCDIGRFGGRCFTYIAAFGAFTDVPYTTDQRAKNLFGRMAYLFEGMGKLGKLRSFDMEIETEHTVFQDSFLFGAVANSLSIAGYRSPFASQVAMDDGLFEVLLIRQPQNAAELNKLISDLLTQQLDQQQVRFFQTRRLKIHSTQPVSWTLDGEDGGSCTQGEICCLRKAITFIAPPQPRKETVEENQPAQLHKAAATI